MEMLLTEKGMPRQATNLIFSCFKTTFAAGQLCIITTKQTNNIC